MEVLSRNTQ